MLKNKFLAVIAEVRRRQMLEKASRRGQSCAQEQLKKFDEKEQQALARAEEKAAVKRKLEAIDLKERNAARFNLYYKYNSIMLVLFMLLFVFYVFRLNSMYI